MLNDARHDKYLLRVVKSLKVRCSDYKEGCEWVGELRDSKNVKIELNNSAVSVAVLPVVRLYQGFLSNLAVRGACNSQYCTCRCEKC